MAKRKAAARTGRKTAAKRTGSRQAKSAARKTAGRRGASARRTAAKAKAKAKKKTRSSAASRRTPRAVSRSASGRTSTRRTTTAGTSKKPVRTSGRGPAPAATTRRKTPRVPATTRTAPALNRARRTVPPDDIVTATPPSSLNLDRTASSTRTGRRELRERFDQHTETGPAITGGDIDADWESAYSVGDEAPGGDNPTPDQDIVDDIGRAVGVEYQDNEELKGEDKIARRDRHRWELDPASSEDYDER
jgi:hypothetical protein